MKIITDYIKESIGEDSRWTWMFYNTKITKSSGWWTGEVNDGETTTDGKELNVVCVSVNGDSEKAEKLAKVAYEKKYNEKAINLMQLCCSNGDKQQAKDIKKLEKLIAKKHITLEDCHKAESELKLTNNDYLGSELYKYFSKS